MKLRIRVIGPARKCVSHWATLRDVSARGIGLHMQTPLPKMCQLIVPLKFREGGGWLVLCEVRNCTEWDDGEFAIGLRFREKIDDPDGNARPPLDWLL